MSTALQSDWYSVSPTITPGQKLPSGSDATRRRLPTSRSWRRGLVFPLSMGGPRWEKYYDYALDWVNTSNEPVFERGLEDLWSEDIASCFANCEPDPDGPTGIFGRMLTQYYGLPHQTRNDLPWKCWSLKLLEALTTEVQTSDFCTDDGLVGILCLDG